MADILKIKSGDTWETVVAIKGDTGPQGPQGEQGIQGIQGDKGDKGDPGVSVTVGITTTGEPGTNASVTNVGTTSDPILDFTIPRGDKGEQGIQGIQGAKGEKGESGVYIGTSEPGSSYNVWIDPDGEDMSFYTKAETDNLLEKKQNSLTAGDNIQISNNVISATDTVYTAGTGITISNDHVISISFANAEGENF